MEITKGSNPSRKERRKDWWQKKKSTGKESDKSEFSKDNMEDKGQRVKLRKLHFINSINVHEMKIERSSLFKFFFF